MCNFESRDYLSKLLNSPLNVDESSLTNILSDKAKTKEYYISIFNQLYELVIREDLLKIKHLSSLTENSFVGDELPVIRECYRSKKNLLKDSNLIILCCKYNKYTILEYLLSEESTILSNMARLRRILPTDEDGESHNAFYYAIKSESLHLLSLLLDKRAKTFFTASSEELDLILSHAHAQLKLNNVSLSREIEIFLEKKLLENRFFWNPTNLPIVKNPDSTKQRKELIIYLISLLDTDESNEVSERFLLILKCIAQNIFVLKHQMKHTYDSLPWEEIEFCVICFIISCTKQEINLFFSIILNKLKIKKYLSYFSNRLKSIKTTKKGSFLNSQRDEVVLRISNECPEFKSLYDDFRQIRDVYSLEKINYFVNLALSADPSETDGRLIIIRCLQGVGEHLKNTLESPKISTTLSDLIVSSLPKNTRRVIIRLRNSLSHGDSLRQRMEIQKNKSIHFFVGLIDDINTIGDVVFDILYEWKIKEVRKILESIIKSVNFSDIFELSKLFQNIILNKGLEGFRKPDDRLRDPIKKLHNSLKNPPDYIIEQFASIDAALSAREARNEKIRNNFAVGLKTLERFFSNLDDFPIDSNTFGGLKFAAGSALSCMKSDISHSSLETVRSCLLKINEYVASSSADSDQESEIHFLITKINMKMEFMNNDIYYINELREELVYRYPSPNKDEVPCKNTDKKPNYYFKEKLLELKNVFIKNGMRPELSSVLSIGSLNEEFHASLEIIILDIMSVLSIFDGRLSDNFRFLDDIYPLLVGKCLRNHIAHDNAVVDLLYSEPTNVICLNALLLLENNLQDNHKNIGKVVPDEPLKVRDMFDERLHLVENKENLFTALSEGNMKQIKSLVQGGADLKSRSIDLKTSFHFASKCSNKEIFRYLVKEGISINAVDGNGQSPLHTAALHGRDDAVEFILKEGNCDINGKDRRGETPLHLAASRGHEGVVKFLLRNNADPDILNFSGSLALHSAVKNNHIEVVKCFHEINGFVDVAESLLGHTALHIAADRCYILLVNFLLEISSNVNAKTDTLYTPLHFASLNGCLEVVHALISKGAEVNAKVLSGCTPLHFAVERGHETIVNILIEKGADVNLCDGTYNYTPLHYAARDGHLGIIKLLLRRKANVSAVTVNGQTPLHFAAQCFDISVFSILLENGANIGTRDNNKMMPLHVASISNNTEALKILIKEGTYINSRCFNNFTPLHLACLYGHSESVNLFVENNADIYTSLDSDGNSPLHIAAFNGKRNIVEIFLEKGVSVNSKNLKGHSPLHIAAAVGHRDVVSLFLNHSAKVNSKCRLGLTALHYGVMGKQPKIVKLLLESKAEVNARTDDGDTPLHLAASLGQKDVVDTLIKFGAEIDAESGDTLTPLLLAARFNHEEVVECLLKNGANVNGKGSTPLSNTIEKPNWFNSLGSKELGFNSFDGNSLLKIFENKISMKSSKKNIFTNESLKTFQERMNNLSLMLGTYEKSSRLPGSGNTSLLQLQMVDQEYKPHCNTTTNLTSQKDVKGGHGLLRSGDWNQPSLSGSECSSIVPLITASSCGHVNIIKLLLKFRADVNKCTNGMTALHMASYMGHMLAMKVLLESKCQVDPIVPYGRTTPLCLAARKGHADIAECLIAHGANINWTCALGTPLILAAALGHAEVVQILLQSQAKLNVRDSEGRTALELAVGRSHLEVVKILVKSKKINLNAKFNGWTLMLIASQEQSVEIVKFLATKGCDIHAKNDKGSKPIHLAAREGFVDTVDYLVSKGCSVNERGFNNQTPLHYAVSCSRFEVVKYLAENGADMNAIELAGSTPLFVAAVCNSSIKIVEYLLGNGAYYNVFNQIYTPQDCTNNANFKNLLSATNELFKVLKSPNLSNVMRCIEAGAVVNATNTDSKTPLFYAAWKGASNVVELLLKNEAKPNAADDKGFTPLHYASKFSHLNIALQLLNFGAVYNCASLTGKTPSNLSKDKSLIDLFNLISDSFKDVENGSGRVVTKLNAVKDLSLLKGIMGATNRANQNLITLAVLSNYPFLQQLKGISQSNVHSDKEIALTYASKGEYNKALGIFQKILDTKIEIFGNNNLSTLEIELEIATILYAQGLYDNVMKILEKIARKQEKMLNSHHEATLKTKSFIALALHRQDRNEQALSLHKETYSKQKEVLGEDHNDTLETYFHMALVLDKLGRHQEALKINQRVFEMRRKVFGDLNPTTVAAQNNIAMVLSSINKNTEALLIYQEVFEKKIKLFGLNHPETLRTSHNIATVLEKLNKMQEALKLYNKISSLQEKVLGLNHHDTLNTVCNMSTLLFHQGKAFSALKGFKKCLPGIECIFGRNSEKYRFVNGLVQSCLKILKMNGGSEAHILQQLQLDIIGAIKDNNREAFYNLLVEGVDINVKDIDGITPLVYAVCNRNMNFIKMLLKYGADVSLTTLKGNTALHIAVSKGDLEIVEILLKNVKRDNLFDLLNARTLISGSSALHLACMNGCLNILKILLQYGANFKIKTNEGKTPVSLSQSKDVNAFLKLLEDCHDLARKGDLKLIAQLKHLKNDEFLAITNARDDSGRTLLVLALENKHIEISQQLSHLLKCSVNEV